MQTTPVLNYKAWRAMAPTRSCNVSKYSWFLVFMCEMSKMMHSEADLLPLSYEGTYITRPQSFVCLNGQPFVVSPSI